MLKQSVLVVEVEEDIRELVSYNLLKEGYQVAGVASGEDALAAVDAKPPDLVLLDLMLPGLDGLSVCRKLKANPLSETIPIVMLTAKGEEVDIVTGLNMGADDYVTKPFSPKVLLARVQAVLRRASAQHAQADEYDEDGRAGSSPASKSSTASTATTMPPPTGRSTCRSSDCAANSASRATTSKRSAAWATASRNSRCSENGCGGGSFSPTCGCPPSCS